MTSSIKDPDALEECCGVVALIAGSATVVMAQGAGAPVKLGIINDQSSVYASASGKGTVAATEMAIADFGGKVLGRDIVLMSVHASPSRVGPVWDDLWAGTEVELFECIAKAPGPRLGAFAWDRRRFG